MLLDRAMMLEAQIQAIERDKKAETDRLIQEQEALLRRCEDTSRLPSVSIEQDGGWLQLPTPSREHFAPWLGVEPSAPSVDTLIAALTQSHCVERTRRQSKTSSQREQADRRLRNARNILDRVLVAGLSRRVGQRLPGFEEIVYVYLAARGARAPKLSVCEVCLLVVKGRARRCSRCRHSPPRPSPRPWHDQVLVADRAPATSPRVERGERSITVTHMISRAPRITLYFGRCQECGEPFQAHSATRRFCDKCGSGRERVRRHRTRRE